MQVTGFDIPHAFPGDFEPVFGMDVRSCIVHYKAAHARCVHAWADGGWRGQRSWLLCGEAIG